MELNNHGYFQPPNPPPILTINEIMKERYESKERAIHYIFRAGRSSEVERSLMVRWVVGSILHGVDPLSYFSFQPVLHDWCNKGRVVCVILSVGWCI